MTKLSSDPTQSLWLENKRAKAYLEAVKEFYAGLRQIAEDNISDPGKIKELQAEYQAEQMETVFRPLSEKYTTLAIKQGRKFAELNIKQNAVKKK